MKNRTRIVRLEYVLITLVMPLLFVQNGFSQVMVTVGVKSWYAGWNISTPELWGVPIGEFASGFLTGPTVNLRSGNWSGTLYAGGTVVPFKSSFSNDGMNRAANHANEELTRMDYSAFLSYHLIPEISVFVHAKYLQYSVKIAVTEISNSKVSLKQESEGMGVGTGIQITVPFPDESPWFTFLSSGVLYNSIVYVRGTGTRDGATFLEVPKGERESELFYFLDGGLGMRFFPSSFGAALGIRVENGPETKTIIGPTANVFYTF